MLLAIPRRRSWVTPKLAPRPSPIEGTGFLATAPIAPGEVCIRIGGTLLEEGEFRAWMAERRKFSALAVGAGLHLVLDDDDPARFGNHSCDAALWHRDSVTLVARRPIPTGTEATVDYALHTSDPEFRMECRCGAAECRGVVTGDDWRRPDVQRRYAGHLSPFLNRRIAAGRP